MARSDEYLKITMQYYVAGRSAVFAAPVAGNLFHHGVEMACLCRWPQLPPQASNDLCDKFALPNNDSYTTGADPAS